MKVFVKIDYVGIMKNVDVKNWWTKTDVITDLLGILVSVNVNVISHVA